MKITIQKTESKEIEIITPAYYRLGHYEMIAIFEEMNIVTVTHTDHLTSILSGRWVTVSDQKKLVDENLSSEVEFFDFYTKAYAALSLLPKYSESDEIENGSQDREDDDKSVNDHYETELHNYGN